MRMNLEDFFNRPSHEIMEASGEELDDAILQLCNPSLTKQKLETEPIIRALVINSIISRRHINRIEARNQVYTWVIIALSITAIIAQVLTIFS